MSTKRRRRVRGTQLVAVIACGSLQASKILSAAARVESLEPRQLLANSIWAYPGADGYMLYKPRALGDHIEDYSNAGYKGGTVSIPDVPVKATVSPIAGDDAANIQAAIDAVSAMPLDPDGFRGAVLLNPGTYEVGTYLRIATSGVVLRGAGPDQTFIHATGTGQRNPGIIRIDGSGSRSTVSGSTHKITDKYVPVGAISFHVDSTTNLSVGDTVVVHRPSTQQWIDDMGMNLLDNPWTPGSKDINMDRTITHIDGNVITIDAPITQALDLKYTDASQGDNKIYAYTSSGRLNNVGVEYLSGYSDWVPTSSDTSTTKNDEDHPWTFINIDGSQNAWARGITGQYFGYSVVYVTGNSKWVTVEDSQQIDPVSIVTGGRRYSFNIDDSSNVLFRNLYTREGRHDFVEGSTVVGPNVFVDDHADRTHADAGPHHRYSTAALWDNVYAGQINIQDRGNSGTGHGHAGANQVIWNSTATSSTGFIVQSPIAAQNWLIGSIGKLGSGGGVGYHTPGLIDLSGPSGTGQNVSTRSLYYQQRSERMAYEDVVMRESRLGDADSFTNDGAIDNPDQIGIDPAWKSSIQTATGKTAVGFDVSNDAQLVPFTFNYSLDPGTHVVEAQLHLGLKSTGGSSAGDRIYIEDKSRSYSWADLGISPPTATADGYVIDLSPILAALQDGKLNVAISGNTAVDWATLLFQTASTTRPTTTTLSPVADAYVRSSSAGSNFGTQTSLNTKKDASNGNQESYLKFDLSSLGGSVTSATLRLVPTNVTYANPATFGSGIGVFYNQLSFVPNDSWTESGITWNNKPGSDPAIDTFVPAINAPLNLDITDLVRAAQAGDKTLSLKLQSIIELADGTRGLTSFASRENGDASLRPQLIINSFNAITPIADTYARSGSNANLNFGTETTVAIKHDTSTSSSNNRVGYLKFDLTGISATPAGATVRLMPLDLSASNKPDVARFVSSDAWTETGLTWNNMPAAGTVLGSWTAQQAAPSEFDVTSSVASTISGDKLLSLQIYSDTASTGIDYYASREHPDAWLSPLLIFKNLAPQITSMQDISTTLGTGTQPTWFGIWDAENPASTLSVSATSSNTTLLPNANIVFGGSGGDRTFALTPAAGESGVSTVTITVTDANGASASANFKFTVVNATSVNGDQDFVGENDTFRVVRNGSFVDVYRNDTVTPALHADYSTLSLLAINALDGDDTIQIDYSGGNPIPAGGLNVDGGAGNDRVSVIGSSAADAVELTAGNIVVNGSVPAAYANAEELDLQLGAGADTLSVAGNGAVSVPALQINLSGGGSLAMAASSSLPDFTDLSVNGATFDLNGQSQTIDALNGASGLVHNNGGSSATLTLGAADGDGSFGGVLGTGSSSLAISKVGAGTQTLAAANTYTGSTTIHSGALRITNPAALGTTSSGTTIGGGTDTGRLELLGNFSLAEPITLSCRTGSNGGNFAPHILNVSGNNTISSNISLVTGGSYWTIQSDAGLLTLSGDLTNNNTSNTRVLYLRGAGQGQITGSIRQTNVSLTQLNKEDAGTWTLSGSDNNFTAATNVNGGVLRVNSSIAGSGGVNVGAGASFIADSTQSLTALTVNDGGSASMTPGANKVLTLGELTIEPAGKFDLADNDAIIDYTGSSPQSLVRGWIATGRAAGAWNGPGINSSIAAANPSAGYAIGYAEASDLGVSSFDSQTVDSTALLLKFTYGGDASFDGQVDVTDLGRLATGWQTSQNWVGGDFNYDGLVDVSDLGILATNWQKGVGDPLAPTIVVTSSTTSLRTMPPARFSRTPIAASNSKPAKTRSTSLVSELEI